MKIRRPFSPLKVVGTVFGLVLALLIAAGYGFSAYQDATDTTATVLAREQRRLMDHRDSCAWQAGYRRPMPADVAEARKRDVQIVSAYVTCMHGLGHGPEVPPLP